jgi:predicted lipid-binding transport protein (Tim44 family)
MWNRQIGALRRRFGAALVPGLIVIAMAALAGCSSGGSSSESAAAAGAPAARAAEGSAPSAVPASASAAAPASGAGGAGQAASAERLAATGRQLIYTAQLTVRARDVGTAISRATSIVSQAGGYVSSENASSDPNHPSQSTATIELKIPAVVYAATLAELASGGLGSPSSGRCSRTRARSRTCSASRTRSTARSPTWRRCRRSRAR